MDLQHVIDAVPTILTSSGLTGGSIFTALIVLWGKGIICLRRDADARVAGLEKELDRTRKDRDMYQQGMNTEKQRADAYQDATTGQVVPALQAMNRTLGELTTAAEGSR